MAADHLRTLATIRPHGPYRLAGLCTGGLIALEMATRLREMGEEVASVIVIDLFYNGPDSVKSGRRVIHSPIGKLQPTDSRVAWVFSLYVRATGQYKPRRYSGRLDMIWSEQGHFLKGRDMNHGFMELATEVRARIVPGNHATCLGRHVRQCAAAVRECLTS
jgi:pimeloyl-ACP methyl ester carboxylesterase